MEKSIQENKRVPRNLCIHVPAVIGRAKGLTKILDIWKCVITDRITKNIGEETNKYICSMMPNYSGSWNTRDADGTEIETLLTLFYSAGVYYGNKVNCVELWRMN
ncbi:hypothetical protein NPIL_157761 [Nephila pilipes]|uniref:Uncharacterized protein n=1 Tax=Nephila pilipes TaxID=299642 RepID=A0A8X6QPV4_NEPPI|nr:hypothetical protein NPIL_157761 [Nephila pilipes]